VETSLVYHIDKGLCFIVTPGREPSGYLILATVGVEGYEKGGAFVCSTLPTNQTIPGLGVGVGGGTWFIC